MQAAGGWLDFFKTTPLHPVRLLPGGVAAIDLIGAFTTADYRSLGSLLKKTAADSRVRGISLLFDSPGGDVAGAFDLADLIAELRTQKPICAIAAETCLSAAYLLASACKPVYCPDTGKVGSIGVVTTHLSVEKALAKTGYAVTLLYAGAHKVLGNSYQDLSPAGKENLSADVNLFYEKLISAIGKYRPQLGKGGARKTEAATYIGEQAISAGLADKIAWPREAIADFSQQINPSLSKEKTMTSAICTTPSFVATVAKPTPAPTPNPAAMKKITRAAFERLSPAERMAFCKTGGQLFDAVSA